MAATPANGTSWRQHPMIGNARSLAPHVRDLAPRIEADGQLPDELVAALTDAEVFQMYQPRSIDGPEVHPLTGLLVCEELARADGSVGWCAQVAAAVTVFLAWLDPDALTEMQATTPGPIHFAGSARPLGRAERLDDGYRVDGRWNYASGVRHANWFLGTCFVDRPDGSTVTRTMVMPVSEGEILPNWDVVGMRGTGSDDFELQAVEVPRRRVAARHWIDQRSEPLYDPRLMMVATWAPTAGVGLGLARGAIDALTDLGDCSSTGSPQPLRERPAVQDAIGEAETLAAAAKAFCLDAIEEVWLALIEGDQDLAPLVARAQLSITHALHEAVRVADLCFHAAGTNAISSANRLERILRDAHTAVQHAAGQPIHRRVAGRALLGLDPGGEAGADPDRAGPTTPRS